MEFFNSLNLTQIKGGTKLKQGDLGSVLSYSLTDENGQEITSFDTKTAYINLVLDDKIWFTTTTLVDISRVTFRIDKAIPIGLYYLEIKIDDYIFPSDRDSIILIEEGSTPYDLKELVPNYDINMTIKGILSDLSQKGIDISDLKTKMKAIYNNALADHAEVAKARGLYPELSSRLNDMTAQMRTVAQNTPKGVFTNLADLQTNIPNGDSGIYVTSVDGHWYYYNNGWKDGGIYQAAKNDEPIELADGWQFTNNVKVIGWDVTSKVIIQQSNAEAMTLKINVSDLKNRVFEFAVQPALSNGQFIVLTDSDSKKILNLAQGDYGNFVNGTNTSRCLEINGNVGRLYFDDLITFYPNTVYIYVTLSNQNIADFYLKEMHIGKPMSNLIIGYINGSSSNGYDPQTKQPIYLSSDWMHYIKIKNTGMGRIKFPSKKLIGNNRMQLLYLLDSDGNVAKNVPYADTLTAGSSDFHEEKDGYVTIFLDKIPTNYPTFLLGVQASVEMTTDWYTVEGAFTVAERFPEISNDSKKVWAMLDDVAYNIVDGQTGYIYPDSFVFNSDLDNLNNLWTNRMIGRKAEITSSTTNVRWLDNGVFVRDIQINKIPSSAGAGRTFNVMLLGESTTAAVDFLTSLKEVCDTDSATFNFVGKRTSGGVNHEAYPGWGIGTLWHAQTANNMTNNFWNPGNQRFDLDYYFTQNPTIPVPDIVSIAFGINDVNRYVTSSKTMIEHYENIIAQFKAKNPNIKILIGLTHAYSLHDNYRGIKARDEIMGHVNELIKGFRKRESEGIYLNPMFYNLDCIYGMRYQEVQAHPFNPSKMIMVGTDNVHPSIYGYKQTAQMTYWSLKNVISNT
ncbi:SGNH/GDSL hydrolase family protein [Streptococcus sp.]|uniref:SGNH/GDSL hydrolase family protein n=1 Tax=Streptococcus sp. TaxID=1306 RepID=UPI003AEF78EB